ALAAIDRGQLLDRLERAIRVGCRGPRNALRAGDVAAALRALLRIIDHVQQLARELIDRAHIYQRALLGLQRVLHLATERAQLQIWLLRRILGRAEARRILHIRAPLRLPLRAPAIHDAQVAVAVHAEQPK